MHVLVPNKNKPADIEISDHALIRVSQKSHWLGSATKQSLTNHNWTLNLVLQNWRKYNLLHIFLETLSQSSVCASLTFDAALPNNFKRAFSCQNGLTTLIACTNLSSLQSTKQQIVVHISTAMCVKVTTLTRKVKYSTSCQPLLQWHVPEDIADKGRSNHQQHTAFLEPVLLTMHYSAANIPGTAQYCTVFE